MIRILALLTIVLFNSKYWICQYFYADDLISWWRLRVALDTFNFALCFLIAYKYSKGFIKDVFMVGMVFCGGDILDRYLFNINEFSYNDFLLILFALIILIPSYAREIKTDTR